MAIAVLAARAGHQPPVPATGLHLPDGKVTGEPVPTEVLRYGLRVSAAPRQAKTEKCPKVVGAGGVRVALAAMVRAVLC